MAFITNQRTLFDIPTDIAYFNTATNSPLLKASAEALVQGAAEKSHPWQRQSANFFDTAENLRHAAHDAVGGGAENWAIVPSASYGISTAARILETHLNAEDEIVIMEGEFPSHVLPWRRVAQETDAKIVTVATPTDFNWTQAVLSKMTAKTKILVLSQCHWTNGAWVDLVQLAEVGRSKGAWLVLDLTQSLGALPFDFNVIKPDFVAAAGYKWLLFPYGVSVLYVAPHWQDARPLEETWLAREGAENFANLVNYTDHYMPGARRFDMGEKCAPTTLPGAIAALRQISDWGVLNISETLGDVNARILRALEGVPLRPLPEKFRAPHILGFSAPDSIPDGLVEALTKQKVYVAQRGSSIRIAPHLHVTDADIDRLSEVMRSLLV